MSIARGEIVGLLGPNGAGKSTLFQIAAGLFAPDGGKRRVVRPRLPQARAANPEPHWSGVSGPRHRPRHDRAGELRLPRGPVRAARSAPARERFKEVSDLLEIGDLLKKPVRNLSGGNQRRVEVARALLNKPDLLLMDEPSTGLDTATREMLVKHMQTLRDRARHLDPLGHPPRRGAGHADRIILIRGGEIIGDGTPAELIERTKSGTDAYTLTDANVALTGAPADAEAAIQGLGADLGYRPFQWLTPLGLPRRFKETACAPGTFSSPWA